VLLLQQIVANDVFFLILVCYFVYGLFNDALWSSDFIALHDSIISERCI
jgi:hypothetical protein